MSDPKELLVSNLTETLRQSQRHMTIGFGVSIFLALFVFAVPGEFKEVKAPIGPVELLVSRNTALVLAVAVYWVAGLLATFFVSRIDSIISLLRDPDVAITALMYPSVLTIRPAGARFVLCVVPPVLVFSGLVELFGNELLDYRWILGVLMLVSPYLQLGWDLRHPIGEAVIKDRAIKLVREHCQNTDESETPASLSIVQIEDKASVVEMNDISCFVRTVNAEVQSYYLVFNLGAMVRKLSNDDADNVGLTKRSTERAKSAARRST